MTEFQKGIIALIKSAIDNTQAELPADFDWGKAVALGKKHQILPILFYGCNNARIEMPAEVAPFLKMTFLKCTAVEQRQNYYIEKMFASFRENSIDFMPLKGTMLRKFYPQPGMRLMSDCDVLIKLPQYEKTREIMRQIGFEEKYESNHELVWEVPGHLTVELHKFVIPSYNEDYFAYFGDGWRLAKEQVGESSQYQMTPEDTLIYNFTHMAKHYRDGGIGIRHILDIYVYMNKQQNLDFAYIDAELKKLKLLDFFHNVLHTIDVWFGGKQADEMSDWITDYIFSSGSYGTAKNKNISAAAKEAKTAGSAKFVRLKRVIRMLFLPYPYMCEKYPIVKKFPVLLPLMWVVRWFGIAFGGKGQQIAHANTKLKDLSAQNIENFSQSLHFVGLDFDFKEK